MARATIVLAHGVLGFGSPAGFAIPINYFNGVAAHLTAKGYDVIAPQVNPIGSVPARGQQLAAEILGPAPSGEKVHVIAHSMGGLDARWALTNVAGFAGRIATLVTIGTPHRGSPVADAIADRANPLVERIAALLLDQLQRNAGALQDLTTTVCARFDATTPDADGVRYIEVAGDASRGPELWLFKLAAAIGKLSGEINDGVVTESSALRAGHEHLDDWPVDHFGEIGWNVPALFSGTIPSLFGAPPEHLARYDAIVAAL
jgi:triacylglycerol lipase